MLVTDVVSNIHIYYKERTVVALDSLTNPTASLTDSHVHIFPEKMMRAVYYFFEKRYGWKLPFSTNPDLLLQDLKDMGVARINI